MRKGRGLTTIRSVASITFLMLGAMHMPHANESNARMPRIRCNELHFETVTGERFFPIGDTAWLLVRLSDEDIAHYIRVRGEQGFNVIKFGPESGDVDFDKLSFILDTLEKHGMYAELYIPAYDYNENELVEDNFEFAAKIAGAFAERANIFAYSLEGLDSPYGKSNVAGMRTRLIEAYRGVKSVDPERLVTFHPRSGRSVVDHCGLDPAYMDFYSVHRCSPGSIEALVLPEINRTPRKPVFLTEPVYEGRGAMCGCNHGCTADQVFEQIMESVNAGVAGISYGHYSVWSFNLGLDGSWGIDPSPEGLPWREALYAPGAQRVTELAQELKN